VLGQEAVGVKSNEIAAIPPLLANLGLAGAPVTVDAVGKQTEIAETIRQRGSDYLLALKGNRPATFTDVAAFFADPVPKALQWHDTTGGNHGRIEIRRHAVCHDVGWLFSDRRYPGEVAFPHLTMVGMVKTEVERDGQDHRLGVRQGLLRHSAAVKRTAKGVAGFTDQVQHVRFSRKASAGVLKPRDFLGVELTAQVRSSMSRAV
jgi:predicted transposase YbfD/YdcC